MSKGLIFCRPQSAKCF